MCLQDIFNLNVFKIEKKNLLFQDICIEMGNYYIHQFIPQEII